MNRLFPIILVFLVLADSVRQESVSYEIFIHEAASEIQGHEDLMGRYEYERLLTADPQTGQIPEGINQAEIQFTKEQVKRTERFRMQSLDIEPAGPFNVGGRIRAVAFDVRDEDVIMAGGVSGGVWKSTDGGQTWIRKSSPANRNSVTCIVQDTRPGRENTWYHGTGEIVGNSARGGGGAIYRGNGIYKSTDNGETWDPVSSTQDAGPQSFNSQFQYIWDIEVNEQNLAEDEILVAAYGGILRSVDGGDSWEVEIGQQLFGIPDDVDLNESDASFYTAIEQSATGVFYATLSTASSSDFDSEAAGIYISRNGRDWIDITEEEEWLQVTSSINASQWRRIVVGISESDPRIAYFLADSNPVFILRHTLEQFDGSDTIQSFSVRETPDFGGLLGSFDTQGSYNMMIRVHPEDPDIVYAGGTNLYRSTDGFQIGGDSKWIGGYNPEGGTGVYAGHHPDQHDLLFYPSEPDKMLSASDGGLRISENGVADSVMWQSINNGFITSQFFTIAQSRVAGDPTLIGGMQDNGTDISLSGGFSSWEGVIGGDGAYAATTSGNALWYASFQRGQTLRLTLNDDFEITSFGRIDPGGLVAEARSSYLFINPFILDPSNENRMFLAGGNHIYFNSNLSQIPGGTQDPAALGWSRVTEDPLQGGQYSALDISLNGETLYFGSSNGVLLRLDSADRPQDFQVNDITSAIFPPSGYISGIAVNPENQDHLVVVFSNYSVPSVFESTDAGETFVDISGNLEENPDGTGSGPSVRWAEIIPTSTGNRYFVGTSTGLWVAESTSGSATTWVKQSVDLIGNSVIPMMDYRASDGSLIIATHGNGVYRTTIPGFTPLEPERDASNQLEHLAYPNPFRDQTRIRYILPEDGIVKVDILSPGGELIRNLLWAPQFAGTSEIIWDGTNAAGSTLANGIYFYRITYRGQSTSGRVMLFR